MNELAVEVTERACGKFLDAREAAIRSSHSPADMDTIMRPYNYEKGKHKVMLVAVEADLMTEGGIVIPGIAQAKTGECVVIDVGDSPPEDLGLEIGQRVQVAKYMGSFVELREKWLDPESGDVKLVTHSYITIDASHILNTFERFEGMHDRG